MSSVKIWKKSLNCYWTYSVTIFFKLLWPSPIIWTLIFHWWYKFKQITLGTHVVFKNNALWSGVDPLFYTSFYHRTMKKLELKFVVSASKAQPITYFDHAFFLEFRGRYQKHSSRNCAYFLKKLKLTYFDWCFF